MTYKMNTDNKSLVPKRLVCLILVIFVVNPTTCASASSSDDEPQEILKEGKFPPRGTNVVELKVAFQNFFIRQTILVQTRAGRYRKRN